MRRRIRIDLGQETNNKLEKTLNRKRQRWTQRNKDRPESENPFLVKIQPNSGLYGDSSETSEELTTRLSNLEFGNYPGYYKYRTVAETGSLKQNHVVENNEVAQKEGTKEDNKEKIYTSPSPALDSRLDFFREEWFKGREVLDVGCNRGHIAYAISRMFSPKLIVGIDIDNKIINMANSDIHLHLEKELLQDWRILRLSRAKKLQLDGEIIYVEDPNHFPLSNYIAQGPLALEAIEENDRTSVESHLYKFPNNIIFLEHNYVLASDELVEKQKARFDTIVCLSVTKWIHLNYRDEGLRRFFKRMYNHLREGGLLILEAQPYDNYSRRKNLSDRLRSNFYSIKFKPDQFDDYLLSDQIGFKRVLHESITHHKCAGFKRPLKVFLK